MGGTCLNRGCIPSSFLIHSADVAETIKRAHLFGIKVDNFAHFQQIVERVNNITDSASSQIRDAFENIENPSYSAKNVGFVSEKTLSIEENGGETITADKILIAMGIRPRIPLM